MTDKEKLEEILDQRDFHCEKGLEFRVKKETLDWLIEKSIEAEQLKILNLWAINKVHWLERVLASR